MRVNAEIRVGDHAGHILAVQVVVGHVDIPHAPSNNTQGQNSTYQARSRIRNPHPYHLIYFRDTDPDPVIQIAI